MQSDVCALTGLQTEQIGATVVRKLAYHSVRWGGGEGMCGVYDAGGMGMCGGYGVGDACGGGACVVAMVAMVAMRDRD